MQKLWRDIEDAKHKAGIGRVPVPVTPQTWDVTAMLGRAATLAGDVAAWMVANAPAACAAALANGAQLLRSVPVVGRLVDLVPVPASEGPTKDEEGARPVATSQPRANGNIRSRPTEPDSPDDPDRGWLH